MASYTSENDPHGQNFPEDLSLPLCHASCPQKSKCKMSGLLLCSSANQQDLSAISSWKMMISQLWSPAAMAGRASAQVFPKECCPWHPHPNTVSLISTLTGGGFQRYCPLHTTHRLEAKIHWSLSPLSQATWQPSSSPHASEVRSGADGLPR